MGFGFKELPEARRLECLIWKKPTEKTNLFYNDSCNSNNAEASEAHTHAEPTLEQKAIFGRAAKTEPTLRPLVGGATGCV